MFKITVKVAFGGRKYHVGRKVRRAVQWALTGVEVVDNKVIDNLSHGIVKIVESRKLHI